MPNYPKAWFYALMMSLGTNEFGVARGFEAVSVPALLYDEDAKCLKGAKKRFKGFKVFKRCLKGV